MFKEDLIKCIYIGFKEGKDEIDNEDDEDYDPTPEELPISCIESQYAYEFGYMMAREEMDIIESEMDDYLESILDDSSSKITLKELIN